jgi:hypothetical protein
MNSKDPKFDLIFGNSISATLRILQEQDKQLKRLSTTESAAFLSMKMVQQQNAAVFLAQQTTSSLASILSPVNALFNAQKSYNEKFKNVFSPVWTQREAFLKFHNQTTEIGKIINPKISHFINSNVRTTYDGVDSISTIEASYLKTFEQIEEEIDLETIQEITKKIQKNPEWREEIKTLFNAFYQEHLRDGFTDAIADFVSRRFNIKNPKIVAGFIAILIILFTIGSTLLKSKQE